MVTYNLVARYIRKYGSLPKDTEVTFITQRNPKTTPLVVSNFKDEVVAAFKRIYGVDLRHEIDIKGAAAVVIVNPNSSSYKQGSRSLGEKLLDWFT